MDLGGMITNDYSYCPTKRETVKGKTNLSLLFINTFHRFKHFVGLLKVSMSCFHHFWCRFHQWCADSMFLGHFLQFLSHSGLFVLVPVSSTQILLGSYSI